jgi:hypothetical protein
VIRNRQSQNLAPTQTVGAQPMNERTIKIVLGYIAIAILVLFVGYSYSVNLAFNAPLEVSNQFLHDIQAGHASSAYVLFSSQAQATLTHSQFGADVAKSGAILNTSATITDRKSLHPDSHAASEITYEIKGTDGKTHIVVVTLTKVNNDWKVLNFTNNPK